MDLRPQLKFDAGLWVVNTSILVNRQYAGHKQAVSIRQPPSPDFCFAAQSKLCARFFANVTRTRITSN